MFDQINAVLVRIKYWKIIRCGHAYIVVVLFNAY